MDDRVLVMRFGRTYERNTFLDDMIEWYIQDGGDHQFPSMDAFQKALKEKNPQKHLIIQQMYLHPNLPNPVRIR
ncbi:hypothetical protein IJ556_05160, partial [bacterium]|nr:hypothetical protein [bacterium]